MEKMLASVDSKIAVRLVTAQFEPTSVSAEARLDDRSCAAKLLSTVARSCRMVAASTRPSYAELLTVPNTYRCPVKCVRAHR